MDSMKKICWSQNGIQMLGTNNDGETDMVSGDDIMMLNKVGKR